MAEPGAAPPPVSPPRSVITNPDWLQKPDGDALWRYYPKQALNKGISGETLTVCIVGKDGRLYACVPEYEWPLGRGFSEAALSTMSEFRMSPKTVNEDPVEGAMVRVPIRWTLPGRREPPTAQIAGGGEASPEDLALALRLTALVRKSGPVQTTANVVFGQVQGGLFRSAPEDRLRLLGLAWSEAVARFIAKTDLQYAHYYVSRLTHEDLDTGVRFLESKSGFELIDRASIINHTLYPGIVDDTANFVKDWRQTYCAKVSSCNTVELAVFAKAEARFTTIPAMH